MLDIVQISLRKCYLKAIALIAGLFAYADWSKFCRNKNRRRTSLQLGLRLSMQAAHSHAWGVP